MQEAILARLAEIEKEKDLEVLYACESGSRSWGFASTDSDYDIRFIYRKPPGYYFQLKTPKRDTVTECGPLLDFHGWDIKKALSLLPVPNASLLEWLWAPIVYKPWNRIPIFRETIAMNSKASIYHYVEMAEGNYKRYINRDPCSLKKYLYVIRPILAARWILQFGGTPPVQFKNLLVNLPDDLFPAVNNLLTRKMAGEELSTGPRMPEIDAWIEMVIPSIREEASELPFQKKNDYELLNKMYREIVFEDLFGNHIEEE